MRPRTSPLWQMPSAEFCHLVAQSGTFIEILERFGLSHRGANYRTLMKRIAEENLSVEHIRANRRRNPRGLKRSLQSLLVADSERNTYHLKNRLLSACLLTTICAACGGGPAWNGMPLTLHLDHINGDRRDNRLENLRLLCPNCHSQTATYAGRKQKGLRKPRPAVFCASCGTQKPEKTTAGSPCRRCSSEARRKVARPDSEVLQRQVAEMGYTKTGRIYGVSDNAVRKWLSP